MDETTTAQRPARTGTDDVGHVADQPALPLLTYDDGTDEPIGYALTARARREVAPHTVPSLRVVRRPDPDDGTDADLERPGDTRPSRARALRRAGASADAIADELGVDELVVRAWVGDVGPRVGGRRARGATGGGAARDPAGERCAEATSGEEHVVAFELARAAARDQARVRMADPAFGAGLGLVSGILSVDRHAATLTTTSLEVAATAVAWLRAHAAVDTGQVRVVLRLGPDVAGDLARHRWAGRLGLPTDRVLHARWRGAPSGEAVEALIRLPDAAIAATLAGWRDALLADASGATDEDTGF